MYFISFHLAIHKLQYTKIKIQYIYTKVKKNYRTRYDTMPRIAQESPQKGLFPLRSFKIVKITTLIH